MKLIRRDAPPDFHAKSGGASRPEWLKEWLEDKPAFVLLKCGCKDDIKIAGTVILQQFGTKNVEVMCDRHSFQTVVRKISLHEFVGITAKPPPAEPLF